MNPIKVMHVIWSGTMGGIEMQVERLASHQARSGTVNPSLLICKKEKAGEVMPGFRRAPFPVYAGGFTSGWDLRHGPALRRLFAASDILHFHAYNPWVATAAIHASRPVVYTVHGNFGFGRRRRRSERLVERLQRRFMQRRTAFLTFNSRFSADVATRRYGPFRAPSRVVYNGFSPGPSGTAEMPTALARQLAGAFVVGTACRFADVKRIELLIDAFATFQRGRNTVLLLIGDGPLRPKYEELIRRYGLEDRVVITGLVDPVRPYEQRVDLFVIPSVKEAFGLVSIEAFSLGKPVLALRDGGGVAEVVGDLAPDDVVPDTAALVRRMEDHFAARGDATMAEQRKAYALRFGIEPMHAAFLDVYRSVLVPSTTR